MARQGYFDDIGVVSTESALRRVAVAFTPLNEIIGPGPGPGTKKSESGITIEFLRARALPSSVAKDRLGHPPRPDVRVKKLVSGIDSISGLKLQ